MDRRERDPDMPTAFRSGSVEEYFWNLFKDAAPLPPMNPEQRAANNANVERWMQEQRDRAMVEIITRLG